MDLTRTKESLGVISRQLGDASYQRALSAGKPALSLYWLWDCLQLASPQPPIADKVELQSTEQLLYTLQYSLYMPTRMWLVQLYTPLPSGGIIGAAGEFVHRSALWQSAQGMQRLLADMRSGLQTARSQCLGYR